MTELEQAALELKRAPAILVLAANGFSISEGLNLFATDGAIRDEFADLARHYSLPSLLAAMQYPYSDPESYWAFWSRFIDVYHTGYQPGIMMKNLFRLLSDKDFFILTTNGEGHFEKAGFPAERILEIEGDFFTVSPHGDSSQRLPLDSEQIHKMAAQKKLRLSESDLPRNEQGEILFVNAGQPEKAALARLQNWLKTHQKQAVVVLELGVGQRNPMIRVPVLQLMQQCPAWKLIVVKQGQIEIPPALKERSLALYGDLSAVLSALN